jgi:hypothetical protein
MSKPLAIAPWALLAAATFTSAAVAQRHMSARLGAGLARPTGTFASKVDPGWQLSGLLDFPLGAQVASLRIELSYVHFGSSLAGENPRMWPLLVCLAAELPGKSVRAFVVGGAGLYYFTTTNPEFTDNGFGWNLGAGARWQRLSLEGRYHSAPDRGDTYWALTLGVRP